MISVIVCSNDPGNLQKIKKNIGDTIGVNFELIAIDNRLEKKGICQVYNEAVTKTNFDILCFIHEDVLIHSENWGCYLADLLSDEGIGLIGVSGTIYKSAYPAIWSACDPSCYRVNTIQHFKNNPLPVKTIINPLQKAFEEVVILDGVFLATRRNIFNLFHFDEQNFTGFHCYDLDFSLQVGTQYKLAVIYNILLEHFSEGSLSRKWLEDSRTLHKKWKNILPKQVGKVGKEQKRRSDFISCKSFLQQALNFSSSKKIILNYYSKLVLFYWKYNRLAYSKTVFKRLLKFNR